MLLKKNANLNLSHNHLIAGVLAASALTLAGCGGGSGSSSGTSYEAAGLQSDTADNVILGIYSDLDTEAQDLKEAVNTLVDDPTESNVEAARQAWIDTRDPWEKSEAFLYGPVDTAGYDPRLDSWPLDAQQLQEVIDGSTTIDEDFVEDQDNNLRGFHTVEYLLWSADDGTDQDSASAVATALGNHNRRADYLKWVTDDVADTATDLHTAWDPEGDDYAGTLASGGEDGNTTYQSQRAAVQEIIQGLIIIANEVGTGKLKPGDKTKVESWYSYNSREDFMDDIRGIKAVYLGEYDGTSGTGVTDYVQAVGSNSLDSDVRSQIDYAIEQIEAIKQPFRNNFDSTQTQNAIDAVVGLRDLLENEVMPLLDETEFAR